MARILLGSMPFISHINPVLPVARRLVEEEDVLVVTTGGRPASSIKLDPLPDNVRVETFIPYNKLMPHVSVMLTNRSYAERRRRSQTEIAVLLKKLSETRQPVLRAVRHSAAEVAVPQYRMSAGPAVLAPLSMAVGERGE